MPVAATGSGSGFSGLAFGWEWRATVCGIALPNGLPPQRTSMSVRSKGSHADLGIIPRIESLPALEQLEVGICRLRSCAVWRGEAVEEVEDGVAGLVTALLLVGGCGPVQGPLLELQVRYGGVRYQNCWNASPWCGRWRLISAA